jgi:hypothetical protein
MHRHPLQGTGNPCLTVLAAAMAALLFSAPAYATSTVTATISDIAISTTGSVTVIDRESVPIDSTILTVQDADGLGGWTEAQPVWATNPSNAAPLTPLDSTVSGVSAVANGSVTASTLTASVSTGDGGGMASSQVGSFVRYALAPFSSVTVSWRAAIGGSNSGANGKPGTGDDVNAYVQFSLLSTNEAPITLSGAEGIVRELGNGMTISFAKSISMQSITFSSGDTATDAYFTMLAYAFTRDTPDAVPEPSTWALQLMGLAALGGVTVRRRRTRASHPR